MTDAPALALPAGVTISGRLAPGYERVLTPDALTFVADLHRRFDARRKALLAARQTRQADLDSGWTPDFAPESRDVREGDWRVRPAPSDLQDRRVEITGPVDRKMIINALNSGARCFMADFEDASSPTWANMIEGQINVADAARRAIAFADPASGKRYALNDRTATLIVRPRGWHLDEAHVRIDGARMSGSLFDFGLYFYHNHAALKAIGSGPYFYLPKLESAAEAQLWADVIAQAEDALSLARGTVRCTVLVETILASFQLHEILYALKDWIVGLNCGRWDYIFSYIKRFRARPERLLPDRAQVTMTAPFMRAYSRLVIETCHARGAHAVGGMSAFIPVKGDEAANARAFQNVEADKTREASDGHDGTWVAHPGMVAAATAVFDRLMTSANQIDRRPGYQASAAELITPPAGTITEAGVRQNVSVGVQYVASWLRGQGAAPIHNLMEDAATAEISRAQLWQQRVHGAKTSDGRRIDVGFLEAIFEDERNRLRAEIEADAYDAGRYAEAEAILRDLVFDDAFAEFLTLPAYEKLIAG